MSALAALIATPSLATGSTIAGLPGVPDPAERRQTERADAAARVVNAVAPEIAGTSRTPLRGSGDDFRTSDTAVETTISGAEPGRISLRRAQELDRLTVTLPKGRSTSRPALAGDGSAVYLDGDSGTDIAVQAFDHGARIQVIIKGAVGATQYGYAFPEGSLITLQDNGGVLIVDARGYFVGGLAPPWAKDRSGGDIPTRYVVKGSSITQVVDHRQAGIQYPVTADPWIFRDLISSATWRYESGRGYTLQVTPTSWSRAFGGSYAVGAAGWSELYAKYSSRGLNTNLDGMRDQFICHQQFAFDKSTYNLDEWRPNYSYASTVNSYCNPGGTSIFD
ncbi:MAG: DUF2599 domain-containing protein [Angustibacter sp.]